MGKNKRYFEGWYLKHQNHQDTVAFIPGISIDSQGKKTAFIQAVNNKESICVTYPWSSVFISKKPFFMRIGENVFSEKGIQLHIHRRKLSIQGNLRYGQLTPLKYDIMGIFKFVPGMECRHGVLSMYHRLYGNLKWNQRNFSFQNGTGYIEKDAGCSFPSRYLWTQCNRFPAGRASVMASIADIPWGPFHFRGCIAVIIFRKKEYRLATYLGARIIKCSERGLVVQQGKYRLEVRFVDLGGRLLRAPKSGKMSRYIREMPSGYARYRFWIKDRLVFDLDSTQAGIEIV